MDIVKRQDVVGKLEKAMAALEQAHTELTAEHTNAALAQVMLAVNATAGAVREILAALP